MENIETLNDYDRLVVYRANEIINQVTLANACYGTVIDLVNDADYEQEINTPHDVALVKGYNLREFIAVMGYYGCELETAKMLHGGYITDKVLEIARKWCDMGGIYGAIVESFESNSY